MFFLAQEKIRLEILRQPSIPFFVFKLITLKDDVFALRMLQGGRYEINVYDRNNMAEAKDVIPLTAILDVISIESCSVSNCVYLLNKDVSWASIFRITKDEHQFRISTWIKTVRLPIISHTWARPPISVSSSGSLIIFAWQESPKPIIVAIYNADGSVQNKIRLSPATYGFSYVGSVSQKSNGNLILVATHEDQYGSKLLEIDTSGRIIHEYQFSFSVAGVLSFAYDRILITTEYNRIEVLDSEFNLLDVSTPWQGEDPRFLSYRMHYDSDRNEMVGYHSKTKKTLLAIFRFTEE